MQSLESKQLELSFRSYSELVSCNAVEIYTCNNSIFHFCLYTYGSLTWRFINIINTNHAVVLTSERPMR